MKMKQVDSMGMLVDEWTHESCIATIGVGNNWATVYHIQSKKEGKGHATKLLIHMKKYYEDRKKIFGSSVALNDRMKWILQKLNIKEYNET